MALLIYGHRFKKQNNYTFLDIIRNRIIIWFYVPHARCSQMLGYISLWGHNVHVLAFILHCRVSTWHYKLPVQSKSKPDSYRKTCTLICSCYIKHLFFFISWGEDARCGEEAASHRKREPTWSVSPERLHYPVFSFMFLQCFLVILMNVFHIAMSLSRINIDHKK